MALLRLGHDRVGFFLQARCQATHQGLQGFADGHVGAGSLAFLFLQLPQVAVDGGLGAGIAQRDADGVQRRMRALGHQGIAGALDVALV